MQISSAASATTPSSPTPAAYSPPPAASSPPPAASSPRALAFGSPENLRVAPVANRVKTGNVGAKSPRFPFFYEISSILSPKNRRDLEANQRLKYELVRIHKELEMNQRPSTDFLEMIQKGDIVTFMRRNVVHMLAEVAEQLCLDLDTVHVAVNYMDRYLSVYAIKEERLLLVAITCLMMAAKCEKQDVPPTDVFSDATSDAYCSVERVLEMEIEVCQVLNFELSVTTARSFLRQFLSAPKSPSNHSPAIPMESEFLAPESPINHSPAIPMESESLAPESPINHSPAIPMESESESESLAPESPINDPPAIPIEFESLAYCIADLSLLEYRMLGYSPSLVAASSIFLANRIISPTEHSWNSSLEQYTGYNTSDLLGCVKYLHSLCSTGAGINLQTIHN